MAGNLDALEIMRQLDAGQIAARLEQIKDEQRALKILMRAAQQKPASNGKPPDASPPANSLKFPIAELITRLQAMPPGTTYEQAGEAEFHGGQSVVEGKQLGTGYTLKLTFVEGIKPEESNHAADSPA